jgi:hypothetical protein
LAIIHDFTNYRYFYSVALFRSQCILDLVSSHFASDTMKFQFLSDGTSPSSHGSAVSESSSSTSFVYTGDNNEAVPNDLKHVTIGLRVQTISTSAFYGQTSLVHVDMNGIKLKVIQSYAFCSCTSLKGAIVPSTVIEIHRHAFQDCTSLESILLYEGLRVILTNAFYHCTSLKQVSVPSTVYEIGFGVFGACSSLSSALVPNGLEVIPVSAFQDCPKLIRITIPSSVKRINGYAFESCTYLISVKLPFGLEVIGSNGFKNCCKLRNVSASSVTNICQSAFENCTELVSVELGEGLRRIEKRAFAKCQALRNIAIPSSVEYTGHDAFQGCGKLLSLLPKNCDVSFLHSILKTRFSELPIHRICYYHGHSDQETAMTLLDEVSGNGTFDCFGMSPYHILALSTVPNAKLLHAMRAKYNEPSHDKWKNTPFKDMTSNVFWNQLAGRTEWMNSILVPIIQGDLDSKLHSRQR